MEFFSGNSGNFAISVKGKGLTNVKMSESFKTQKVKFNYKSHKLPSVSIRFTTVIFVNVLFLRVGS